MMEALPRSSTVIVDAIPTFLEKLQVIQCMDVAEQSLSALEMLSKKHNKSILHAKGVTACLTYLDFFSITAQRNALAVTSNCCQNLLPEEFIHVCDVLGILSSRLIHDDKKSSEMACLALSRLAESYKNDRIRLRDIATQVSFRKKCVVFFRKKCVVFIRPFYNVSTVSVVYCGDLNTNNLV